MIDPGWMMDNWTLIVAMSENRVIGRGGRMPWHLSRDLKRFRHLTMGHAIIMGRKTFQSIGRCLPGRRSIVITRQPDFQIPGNRQSGLVVDALEAAAQATSTDPEAFVIGGGEIYRAALPSVKKIYLTLVHACIHDGDAWFPEIDFSDWELVHAEDWPADENNDFACSFQTLVRKSV